MYMHYLPEVLMRQHYSTASLEAAIRNMMGGKSEKGSKKTLSPDKAYTVNDCLPWFAKGNLRSRMSIVCAVELKEYRKEMPYWALNLVDWMTVELISSEVEHGS